jgi:hypothetical protein
MALPKSVTRVKKDGVEFVSHVDRVQYDINELSRAALRDVGKYLRTLMMRKGRKLRGLSNFKIKRIPHAFQYWVRRFQSREDNTPNLWIGSKHNTWYADEQELGTNRQPKRGIIKNTVMENLGMIQTIESKYLSAVEDELKAKALISEEEYEGDEDEG